MASAFVNTSGFQPDGHGITLIMQVIYSGADVGGVQVVDIGIPLSGGESPVALRQSISATVVEQGAQRGWTVATSDITMPTFQKG